MEKRKLLSDVADLKEAIENGEVTDMIIAYTSDKTCGYLQYANPQTASGLAHYAVFKTNETFKSMDKQDQMHDFLKGILGEEDNE